MSEVIEVDATYALTTLERARSYLNLPDNEEDATVAMLVNQASGVFNRRTRRVLKSRAQVFVLDGGSNPRAFASSGYGYGGGYGYYDAYSYSEIVSPEWPVTTLTRAEFRDSPTTWRDLNIDGAILSPGGIVYLQMDAFPRGRLNIRLSVTAGYLVGTHDAELAMLEQGVLRLTHTYLMDRKNVIARGSSISSGGDSIVLLSTPLPSDVEDIIQQFA